MVAKTTQWASRKWIIKICYNLLHEKNERKLPVMDTFYGDNRTSAHFSGLILSKYIPPTFYSNNTNGKSLMYKNCPVSLALVLVVGHVSLLLKSSDTHHDQDNSPLNCAANHDLASGLKGENTTINEIEVTPSGLTS